MLSLWLRRVQRTWCDQMNPDKIGKLHQHNWRAPRLGRTPTGTLECHECDLVIDPEDQKFWDKLYDLFAKCEEWRAAEKEEDRLRLRASLTERISGILRLTRFCQLRDYQAHQDRQPVDYRHDDYALWIMVQKGGIPDGWVVLRVGIEFRSLFRSSEWEVAHIFGDDLGEERFEPQMEPAIHDLNRNLPFDRVVRRREQDRGARFRYVNEDC